MSLHIFTCFKLFSLCAIAIIASLNVRPASAHVSEQGFVLLLPTGTYILSGVAAVALTVVTMIFLPDRLIKQLFATKSLVRWPAANIHTATSLFSLAFFGWLVWVGFYGVRDPLENALPLFIWTLWWIAFVVLQALIGDIWHWVNPWTGIYRLICGTLQTPPLIRLPDKIGSWPGIAAFLVFASFFLADLAPDDPARLASFIVGYAIFTYAGMLFFSPREWLARGECFTMLLRSYATLSAASTKSGAFKIGLPGWQLVAMPGPTVSGAVFIIMILATGTFDGLNETFWWLAQIGVNPLEFPGRSAVIWQTLAGLLIANLGLPLIFAFCTWLGLLIAGESQRWLEGFTRFSRAILPIALAYHFAHFFTTLLVNGQYALVAASDPLHNGADYLGLGKFYVTTGFFNSRDTVELIWLTQATVIVLGHMLAILVSHAIALDMLGSNKKAALSQIPVALFMILYTLLGLWLLASPKGA